MAIDFETLAAFFGGILLVTMLIVVWIVIWLVSLLFRREATPTETPRSSTTMLSVTAAFIVLLVCFAFYVAHPMVTLLSVGAIVLLIHVAHEALQPHAYTVRDLLVVMTVVSILFGAIAFVTRR